MRCTFARRIGYGQGQPLYAAYCCPPPNGGSSSNATSSSSSSCSSVTTCRCPDIALPLVVHLVASTADPACDGTGFPVVRNGSYGYDRQRHGARVGRRAR